MEDLPIMLADLPESQFARYEVFLTALVAIDHVS